MEKVIIIADDLTGAADTGLQFRNHGLSATILLDPRQARPVPRDTAAEVVVVSTETRGLSSEAEARAVLEDTVGRLFRTPPNRAAPQHGPLLVKKIDSTLRGWVGAEVAVLLERLPGHVAWIVPSYPRQGRQMRGGVYTIHGTPLADTPFARDIPGLRSGDSRVAPLLQSQMGQPVGFVGLEAVAGGPDAIASAAGRVCRGGVRAVLLDATTEAQITDIVAAGERFGSPVLWVGSAGMAGPLAAARGREISDRHTPHESQPAPTPAPVRSRVVVAAGSRHPVTQRQVAYLRRHASLRHLALVPGADVAAVLDQNGAPSAGAFGAHHCLLTLPEEDEAAPFSRERQHAAASLLGETAARLTTMTSVSRGLLLTGGDIAAATCRHLGVAALEIVDAVEEGLPRLRLRGGSADGAFAVTKAGGFGADSSLFHAFVVLSGGERAEQEEAGS